MLILVGGFEGYSTFKSTVKNDLDILGPRLHFSQVYIVNHNSLGGRGSIPSQTGLWALTTPLPLVEKKFSVSYSKDSYDISFEVED